MGKQNLFKTTKKNRSKAGFTIVESVIAMAIIIVMIALVVAAAAVGAVSQTKSRYQILACSAAGEMYSAFSGVYCASYYNQSFYDDSTGEPDDAALQEFIYEFSDQISYGLNLYQFSSERVMTVESGVIVPAANVTELTIRMDITYYGSNPIGARELSIESSEANKFSFTYVLNTVSYEDDAYTAVHQATITAEIDLTENAESLFSVSATVNGYKNAVFSESFTLSNGTV